MARLSISFLETEITIFPKIMKHIMGKFYNNTLYNGITWMVFVLHIIRFLFELAANGLLKKMGFKEYLRLRLKKSIWYLGFYTCSYLYCFATLWKNNIIKPDVEKFDTLDLVEPISGHLILGYILLCAFFISSAMWEGLSCSLSAFTYLFLTGFVAFTYFFSYIELSILLAKNICIYHITTEITRCLSCILKAHLNISPHFIYFGFVISIATFINFYVVTIPREYIIPIVRGFIKNSNSAILFCLNASLWGWFLSEIFMSPLYRLLIHKWSHESGKKITPECLGSTIECALFQQRDDVAYNLTVIRREIRDQEARLKALRQPKRSARMLLQTLKCVAAINRRAKIKRLSKESEDKEVEEEQEVSNNIFDLISLDSEEIDNAQIEEQTTSPEENSNTKGTQVEVLEQDKEAE